jgi:hypothetical protein
MSLGVQFIVPLEVFVKTMLCQPIIGSRRLFRIALLKNSITRVSAVFKMF